MNDFIIDSGCSQSILMNKYAIENYIYTCFTNIPAEIRQRSGRGHKLLPKAFKMIMVRYSNHHNGWKLYDPKTKRIVVSDNVQFGNETTPLNGVHQCIPSLTDLLSQQSDSGLRGNIDVIPENTSINPESTAESNKTSSNVPNDIETTSTSQSPLVETVM
jgi:hypothetical protein